MRVARTYTFMSNRLDICNIYADPQTEELLLGSAKLLNKVRKGEVYVLGEVDENHTSVFEIEYWTVDWIELTPLGESVVHKEHHVYPVRRLKTTGLSSSYYNKSRDRDQVRSSLRDHFIEVNGKEIY